MASKFGGIAVEDSVPSGPKQKNPKWVLVSLLLAED